MKERYCLPVVVACCFAFLFSYCGSTVENEDTVTVIALCGTVKEKIGNNTSGAAGLEVRLAKVGLADTTDSDGNYSISADRSTLRTLNISLDTLHDSVVIRKDNQVVSTLGVVKWIDSLPTVYLIQRNIGGKFDTKYFDASKTTFSKVSIIIKNSETVSSDSAIINAGYIKETAAYSCFVFFRNPLGTQNRQFSIYARVFDTTSRFIGQSRTLSFDDKAGNIDMPTFNPFNAVPVPFAGNDTIVFVKDTIMLRGSAIDSFGIIQKWEWDVGNKGQFITATGGTTRAVAPSSPDTAFLCILKVTDNDGNVARDTAKITVKPLVLPVAYAGKDFAIFVKDTFVLSGSAVDSFGIINKWEWDIGNTGLFVTGSDSTIKVIAPSAPDAAYLCILRVTDKYGSTAHDTVKISVKPFPLPVAHAGKDTSVFVKDTFMLKGSAVDSLGTIKKWEWDIGNTGLFVTGSDSTIKVFAPSAPDAAYFCILRVTDNHGGIDYDTVKITVKPFPLPVAHAGKDTSVFVKDTFLLRGSAVDSLGTIKTWEWDIGNTGLFVTGSDSTIKVIAPSAPDAAYLCILRVTDNHGGIDYDTVKITVKPFQLPVAIAGKDTTVFVKDTFMLRGSAVDSLGTIKKWEWDIGNTGLFVTGSDSTIKVIAPSAPDAAYLCILRVTDNHSGIDYDTVKLTVKPIPPPRQIGYAAVRKSGSSGSCIVPIRLLDDTIVQFDNVSIGGAGVVRLDASSDTNVWYCDSNGGLWKFSDGSFAKNDITITGSTYKCYDLGVNGNGGVCAAGEGTIQNFYQFTNNTWQSKQGLVTKVDIPPAPNSLGFCIGSGADVFQLLTSTGWTVIGTLKAVEISIGSAYYGISLDSLLYRWNGSSWLRVTGPFLSDKIARIETNSNDDLLLFDAQRNVYFRDKYGNWHGGKKPAGIDQIMDITIY